MERTQGDGRKNATQSRAQRRAQERSESGTESEPPALAANVRVVLDALPQPAFLVAIDDDEVCQFVHANARYRELFDLDLESDLGGDLRGVLPADVLVPHITAKARPTW